MDAEDLLLDDSADGEVIEDVSAVAPDIHGTVLAKAFVVETVDLRNLARFVVASDKTYASGVLDLQEEKEEERFD